MPLVTELGTATFLSIPLLRGTKFYHLSLSIIFRCTSLSNLSAIENERRNSNACSLPHIFFVPQRLLHKYANANLTLSRTGADHDASYAKSRFPKRFLSRNRPPRNDPIEFSARAKGVIADCAEGIRQGKVSSRCTVVERSPASTLVSALIDDLRADDQILEINPGFGFVSRELLARTKNSLVLFEPREWFCNRLATELFAGIKQGRVIISGFNFANFYSYYLYHRHQQNREAITNFLDFFPGQREQRHSNVKIVGAINDRSFFSKLAFCAMLEISFFEKTFPTFYLYTTDRLFKQFFSNFPFKYHNNNFKHSLQNHFLFKVDRLATECCSGFHPLLKPRSPGIHSIDTSLYHLIRIEPNWAFFAEFPKAEREVFMYFLMQMSQRPSRNLLIDTLEKWLPDIGVSLIDAGFNVYTFTQELSKEEILFVYHMFRQHPSFPDCSFMDRQTVWLRHILTGNEPEATKQRPVIEVIEPPSEE